MRKKLSFLIALAISLNISTISLAAAPIDNSANSSNVTGINVSDITLDEALNTVQDRNIELKSLDVKINALSKQLDDDKNKALNIEVNGKDVSLYNSGEYASVAVQKEVTPIKDQQNLNDAKNNKDEKLNSIKFDLEKQYMNAITAQKQIDNLNKNISDLDEQIKQMQAKIDLGQSTKDSINPLLVQKSKLLSQLNTPYMQQKQAILNIKKYLNVDLNNNLNLAYVKNNFVKFDDTNIESRIIDAATNDYAFSSIEKNIDIQRKQVDIQVKYAYNSDIEPENSKLTLEDLQNQSWDTNSSLKVSLWNAYYTLKNKENTVQAQIIAEESANLSYNKAKDSFNNGMIDKVALDSVELALNNQKVSTEQAINDYMITQKQFNYCLNGHASMASSIQ